MHGDGGGTTLSRAGASVRRAGRRSPSAMITNVRRVLRLATASAYLQNSVALISGTVITQGLVFLFSPFLSRIFSLVDFGNLANYNAWVAVLALVGSFRYEHAIIVAKGPEATDRVTALTAVLSLGSVLVYLVTCLLLYFFYTGGGYIRAVRPIIPFIPLGVLVVCVSSPLVQLCVKTGKFKRVAVISAVQVVFTVLPQIALGVLGVRHGLIVGTIVGYLLSGLLLARALRRDGAFAGIRSHVSLSRLRETALEFSNFPRYTLAADAIGVVMQQFIPVFVLALFNPAVAGLYSFSTRIVRVPLIVISTAVSTALRKEAADTVHGGHSLRRLFRATVRTLAWLSLGPFVLMLLFSRPIFGFVFGQKWIEAGRIVQILSPGILFEFVAFPLTVIFLVTNTQRFTFRVQLAGFIGLVVALALGSHYLNDFVTTCYLISVVMVAVNATSIYLASRVASAPAWGAPGEA